MNFRLEYLFKNIDIDFNSYNIYSDSLFPQYFLIERSEQVFLRLAFTRLRGKI